MSGLAPFAAELSVSFVGVSVEQARDNACSLQSIVAMLFVIPVFHDPNRKALEFLVVILWALKRDKMVPRDSSFI